MVTNALLDLTPYLLALTGVGLTLVMFIEMKRKQLEFQTRWTERQQTVQSELGKIRGALQDLKVRIEEAERRAETMVPPEPPKSGINISRRAQAVRLFRRGDRPDQIAAALGLVECEVELLQKIYRIVTAPDSTMNPEGIAASIWAMESASEEPGGSRPGTPPI